VDRAKPFDIPKREVWEAYKRVKANQGAAGVDGQTIEDFEVDLANNLYKLWNRICSTRLNDRFPLQDSANRLIRIESASCCGANDRSNGSEKIGAPV
jgi:hypothetical protein